MSYPIGLEEARRDAAVARKALADLERKKATLLKKVAAVDQDIRGCQTMLRTICGVYPELAEAPHPRPLADLFGSDPDFTGGLDSVAFVREGRGD